MQRRARRRRAQGRHHDPVAGAIVFVAVVVLGVAASAAALFVVSPGRAVGSCDLNKTPPRVSGSDSFVYAADGRMLGVVPSARNREPVPLAQVAHWMPTATVAVEDRRFWHHGALDPQGVLRAVVADVRAGNAVQGGSTLTQQLVRARYLAGERMTVRRKLREACLALEVAAHETKRRILEQYLNTVYYGHRAYGAQAAAFTYFAHPASQLTLPQAALLAGLPQAPSRDDPLQHPRAALERRDAVLSAMLANHEISRAQFRSATAEPLGLQPGGRYLGVHAVPFFDTVVRQLGTRFGAAGLRQAGLHVTTTLDWRLQGMAERALSSWLQAPTDPAGALVAIEPRTGAIRALATLVPGKRRMRFNLATQAHRQAGSAFKTFTLTAAIEHGISLDSVWNGPSKLTIRNPRCDNGTVPWTVHNFADESAGTMNLLSALAHSVNTIFAQVALKAGLHNVVDAAHRLGVRSPLTPVCALTLGPEGVSPLEMTNAFATLAAAGMRRDPQIVQRMTAAHGAALALHEQPVRRAISAQTAQTVTYALSGVIQAGTGTAANIGRPAAGKTGTAESEKDAWFCGFVPQLATCVWIGHPNAEIPMTSVAGFSPVVGGSVPARIWHDFMLGALTGVPVIPLPSVRTGQITPARPSFRTRQVAPAPPPSFFTPSRRPAGTAR